MKQTTLVFTGLIYVAISFNLAAQGTGENFPFSSYEEFDLERGYEPGSIIVITKEENPNPNRNNRTH